MRNPWPYGKKKIILRLPAGFGDSIYDIAIVKELRHQFPEIKIRTRHPSLFTWMDGVTAEPWRKHGEDITAHYSGRKQETQTNQWQDLLISCRLDHGIPFVVDWKIHNQGIIDKVKNLAAGKPVCIVTTPHLVFGRSDGYGHELTPKWDRYDEIVKSMSGRVFFVEVGLIKMRGVPGCDLSLVGKASDTDTLDLASSCDFVLGQHGYAIPLAEAFDKPLFVIYSDRGLRSNDPYIRYCTAKKTFSKTTSRFAVDNEPTNEIVRKAHECFSV